MKYPACLLLAGLLVMGCGREGRDDQATTDSASAPAPPAAAPAKGGDSTAKMIRLEAPAPGSAVTSPLTVRGEARGPWYFEASFPVYLIGPGGDTLAAEPAQAQGEWMTEDWVPFSATLTFTPQPGPGTLVLSKANASGLPEHDDAMSVPVNIQPR